MSSEPHSLIFSHSKRHLSLTINIHSSLQTSYTFDIQTHPHTLTGTLRQCAQGVLCKACLLWLIESRGEKCPETSRSSRTTVPLRGGIVSAFDHLRVVIRGASPRPVPICIDLSSRSVLTRTLSTDCDEIGFPVMYLSYASPPPTHTPSPAIFILSSNCLIQFFGSYLLSRSNEVSPMFFSDPS